MKAFNQTAEAIEPDAASAASVIATLAELPELESVASGAALGSLNHVLDVSVRVTAELGRVTMSIGEILKLGPGSVVGLDRGVTEPVDLLVQGVLYARGDVVVVDERFAIRIREIIDPKQSPRK